MIWFIIIISVLILLLAWILVAPVIIFLDTDHNRYFLSLPGIFKAMLIPSDRLFHIRFRIFFVPFTYDPFTGKPDKKRKEKKTEKKKPKKISGLFKLAIQVLLSFRIRKFELDIDTDDYILNAWLIPVFSTVNSENIQLRANFVGYASLVLDLRTRIGTLLWIYISNKMKSF